ncbi:MAG: DbpA RNA binding domain-containing protein, partial [Verrucomicrobiota bacterium]
RTGRAITFVAGREIYKLQNIQRFTQSRIRREKVPSLEEVEQKRANLFFDSLKETLEKGEFKRHDEIIDRLLEGGHSPTDIASALIHLLGDDKASRPGQQTPEEVPQRESRYADSRPSDTRSYPKYEPRTSTREAAPARARSTRADRESDAPRTSASERRFPDSSVKSHEAGMARLVFNVGRDQEILPGDIVGVIAGVAKLPKEFIGAIQLQPRQTLVDVAEDHAKAVVKKLNGIKFKGNKLAVSFAA